MPRFYSILIVAGLLITQCVGRAEVPPGDWAISGKIQDFGMASLGPIFTNTFTITGHCQNGQFILETTPIKTLDDTAESVGWDGKWLYLIQRSSPVPHNEGVPRTNATGYIEPNVFSDYATYGLTAVLLALADSNQVANLEQKKIPVILGNLRIYPEENNTYKVSHSPTNLIEIEAVCPGLRPGRKGLEPIPEFEQGFTRWRFKSSLVSTNKRDGGWTISAKYDEFVAKHIIPTKRQLQVRGVTAEIVFSPENHSISSFLPTITEDQLAVMDYSSRNDFFQWTKGQFDWHCDYVLTNKVWDLPTNYITAQVADISKNFAYWHGLPPELLDYINTGRSTRALPQFGKRRVVTLCVFAGISIISAALFWFSARRETANSK